MDARVIVRFSGLRSAFCAKTVNICVQMSVITINGFISQINPFANVEVTGDPLKAARGVGMFVI